jgi:hypothetical protein
LAATVDPSALVGKYGTHHAHYASTRAQVATPWADVCSMAWLTVN